MRDVGGCVKKFSRGYQLDKISLQLLNRPAVKCLSRLAKSFVGSSTRSGLLLSVLILTNPASARAQEVTCVLVSPSQPLTAGTRGDVWLYCQNNSSNEVRRTFEPNLDGTLTSGTNSFKTVLALTNRSGIEATIAPGSFVKQEYLFDVPSTLGGQVTLDASNYNQVVILVKNNPAGTPATPATSAAPSLLLMEFLGRHIYGYEPIYFLLGQYPGAEFQFSLKYKLFDLTGDWNPLAHSYFAYTQTSFWDLFSRGPSFYDTSYKPSAFLFYPGIFQKDRFQLDLQGGYEHESNGRGGSMERSLNTIYLQPTARFDLPAHFQLTFQTRAWYYLTLGSNNPDLPDYRGYADLLGALAWTDPQGGEKIQFATRLRIGDEGSHAGLLFDLRFNLPHRSHFNPAIQLQYFTGYGQTLRQYDQTSHAFRAGLCIWY